jgi:hypothetical protein
VGKGRHVGDRPTHPIYADQRRFGLTLNARAKTLAVVMTILVVINGVSILLLIDYLSTAHEQRQRDNKQLACLLIEDTPRGNQLGDEIRAKYHCTTASNRHPSATTTSTVTHTVTPGHRKSPIARGPSRTTEAPKSTLPGQNRSTRTSTTTRTVHVPAPSTRSATRTSRATSKPKPTPKPSPTPSPSGILSGLCQLLPLICQVTGG